MKNIIITGTSRGIGYEMVAILAQAGHNVLALSRNAAPVSGLEITNCHCFSCDITDPDAIKKVPLFLKEKGWKHVDVLMTFNGTSLNGSTVYVYGLPVCSECAKGLIQVGVKQIVMSEHSMEDAPEKWIESCELTVAMLNEAGIHWKTV